MLVSGNNFSFSFNVLVHFFIFLSFYNSLYNVHLSNLKKKKIQELHSDYPLAPDEIEIKRKMLPEYQLKIADLYNIPIDNVKKIVPNFSGKEKYIIRYGNLKLYLSLGLKAKKIHSVLEFNQSQFLNPYIEFNSQKKE